MKLSSFLLAGTAIAGLTLGTAPQASATPCPVVGSATGTGCGVLITFNANGSITTSPGTSGPFDGIEDTGIGVINHSNHAISSLNLTQTTPGTAIFGFDRDGYTTFGVPGNSKDATGYGGSNAFYTNITASLRSGTVNFITAIAANGGTGYFGLEGPASLNFHPSVPEPASLALLGAGLLGVGLVRRKRKTS